MPKLKKVYLRHTTISNTNEKLKEKAVLKNLKVLEIRKADFCFDLLSDTPKLEKLIADLEPQSHANFPTQHAITGFDDYFKTLNTLKYLELVHVLKPDVFYSDGFDLMKINLEVLKICQCNITNIKYLENFIKTQNKIVHFELSIYENEVDEFGDFVELLDFILKLTTLKTFGLETKYHQIFACPLQCKFKCYNFYLSYCRWHLQGKNGSAVSKTPPP